MSRRLLGLGCWLMVVVFPLNVMATDAFGVLNGVGAVTIDGRAADAGGAVFAGDVIATGAGSKATLSGRSKTVSLAENSTIRVAADALELQSGAVVISSTGAVLRSDNIIVVANQSAPSRFIARKVNGEVEVLALEGSVSVSDGQETTQVPATKGVKFPRIGKPGWLRNDDIGILIVVAAAIIAGVTIGIINSQQSKAVTPPGP